MQDTIFDLTHRRAIRKYTEETVTKEELKQVLEAGIFAPTAAGFQRACIVCVTNKEQRDKIEELNAAVIGDPAAKPFYGAPVVLVVFADNTWPMAEKDGSLILGNLMNAAYATGLGSCWIDRAKEAFESEEGKKLKAAWGVPEDYIGVGHCIIGHPAENPVAAPRHPGYVIYAE